MTDETVTLIARLSRSAGMIVLVFVGAFAASTSS